MMTTLTSSERANKQRRADGSITWETTSLHLAESSSAETSLLKIRSSASGRLKQAHMLGDQKRV